MKKLFILLAVLTMSGCALAPLGDNTRVRISITPYGHYDYDRYGYDRYGYDRYGYDRYGYGHRGYRHHYRHPRFHH